MHKLRKEKNHYANRDTLACVNQGNGLHLQAPGKSPPSRLQINQ